MTTETTKQNRITVVLDQPIKRGETLIESIELRRPTAGELRGDLERLAATDPATPIRFLGALSSEAAQAEIA